MSDHVRDIDRWLKWVAIIGPVFGFVFGMCAGTVTAYQAFKHDSDRIELIEGWKNKQEDFNKETIRAVSALQEIVKRIR